MTAGAGSSTNTRRSVALVTGGRRGIGLATAERLARDGFAVAITEQEAGSELDAAVARIAGTGSPARGFVHDLVAVDSHAQLVEDVVEALGGLDLLVNNAGIGAPKRGDLLDMPHENFDRVIDVNLRGPFFLTQAAARWMTANPKPSGGPGNGRAIVSITSVSAEMASPERGEYCISKAGMAMATRLYALRLAEAGIGVFEVRPGIIRTPMTEPVADAYDGRIRDGLVPARRWGTPDDVAAAVAMLARGEMAFATGSVIQSDGGLSIARL